MRGLALCVVAAALVVSGCGSDNSSSSKAPKQQPAAQSGAASGSAAGVSAQAATTPSSLCAPEGKGKPKKQCVAGLTKLGKGKAKNPRAACKGLSKKKTKGVRGKSPFAVCVKAAAALMASKNATAGNGSATAQGGNGSGSSDSGSADDSSSSDSSTDAGGDGSADTSGLICTDVDGNVVPVDSPDVNECDDVSASDSSSGDTSTDATSTDDTSTDGG
jgi:hypothetical protein